MNTEENQSALYDFTEHKPLADRQGWYGVDLSGDEYIAERAYWDGTDFYLEEDGLDPVSDQVLRWYGTSIPPEGKMAEAVLELVNTPPKTSAKPPRRPLSAPTVGDELDDGL